MNILFILPEYYPHSGGGISTYYLQHIALIKPHVKRIKVIVGSAYTQSFDGFLHDEIEVEYLKPYLFLKYLDQFKKFDFIPQYKKTISSAWAMWEQANAGEGFDLVECTDFGLGFIPWLINHELPVVTRLHGSSGQIELHEQELKEVLFGDQCRQTELSLLEKSDALVTHSQSNHTFWKNIFPNKQIALINPLFDKDIIQVDLKQKMDFGIVCGRIQEWKGPDILCQSVEKIDDPRLLIKWYGRDTMYSDTLSKSTQLSKKFPSIWNHKVIPQQPLPPHQLEIVQKEAKFAVIPSTWDMYNFTCLEYMSVGTLVICSDGAGVSSLIENGVNGFKYPANDADSLALCIEKSMNIKPEVYQEMTKNAIKTIRALGDENLIQEHTDLLFQTLNKFEKHHPNLFIEALYKPLDKNYEIDIVLNKLPLSKILKHISTRLKRKFKVGKA